MTPSKKKYFADLNTPDVDLSPGPSFDLLDFCKTHDHVLDYEAAIAACLLAFCLFGRQKFQTLFHRRDRYTDDQQRSKHGRQ
jgi:hypothetical protein